MRLIYWLTMPYLFVSQCGVRQTISKYESRQVFQHSCVLILNYKFKK
jgi:hypothetical protein